MSRPKIIDIDKIKKELGEAIQVVGKEIGKEIEIAYDLAIDQFYAAYEPTSYRRTESTLKASSANNGKPSYKKTGELSCEAGITVDPSYMGQPYFKNHGWQKASADFIFERTWDEGIHGFTDSEVVSKKKFVAGGTMLSSMIWIPMEHQSALSRSHNFLSGYHAVDSIGSYKRSYRDKYRPERNRIIAPPKTTPPSNFMKERFNDINKSIGDRIDAAFNFSI